MLLFGLATFIQLLFWGVLFTRLCRKIDVPEPAALPPLSVIVCARNEAPLLAERLPFVLEQDYPDFEVLVVDHASTDDTASVLEKFQALYPHLRVLHCADQRVGKKIPLSLGLREARHEWVALTDADCRPASRGWLRALARRMTPGTDVALGYGPLEKTAGFQNAFARFEAALTAIQYGSYALAGVPYMGVGRNLAYRKSAIAQPPSGYAPELLSGDDDLVVNAIAHAGNTSLAFSPKAFAWSPAPRGWRAFFRQKSRHLSASTRYKPHHQALLGAWALSFIGHYALGILSLLNGSWALFLAAYLSRQIVAGGVFFCLAKKLEAPDLRWKFPLLDFALFLYYLLLTPAIWLGGRSKWK
jgi:cellulose synthase/poly-beta-1,6-N-acetylglucosamine synthase-like glycosyltransferase